MWRDPDGNSRRKLLLTPAEIVDRDCVAGETEPGNERKARPRRPAQQRTAREQPTPRAEA